MRVHPAGKIGYAAGNAPARRGAGASFTLAEPPSSVATPSAAAPRAVADIGALVVLQGFEDVAERRRRAVKRGTAALDALEEIKLGLLAGSLDTGALERLKANASALNESSGDPRLDSVLAEVDLRAAVELAKLGSGSGREP